MGSCPLTSPVLHHNYKQGIGPHPSLGFGSPSPIKRYNISRPVLNTGRNNSSSNRCASSREPLKPIHMTNTVSPGNRMPVVRRHSDNHSSGEVDRICKIIEKHDEQLQQISQQIETLLRLQKEMVQKPVTCNAETNTSRVWPLTQNNCRTPSDQGIERRTCGGSGNSDPRRGILRKTVTHETTCTQQSIECGRFGGKDDENDQRFYHTMLSDISDILSRSETDDSIHSHVSPVKRRCTTRTRVSEPPTRHSDPVFGNAGSETIYIKHMAAKYLSNSQKPTVSRDPVHQYRHNPHRHRSRRSVPQDQRTADRDVTSIATKNYLQRYGLTFDHKESDVRRTKPHNKLLDLSELNRLPKFV